MNRKKWEIVEGTSSIFLGILELLGLVQLLQSQVSTPAIFSPNWILGVALLLVGAWSFFDAKFRRRR